MFSNNNCGVVPVMNVGNNMGWGNGMMNGMWGEQWWIWILFFAMWGWGGNGWGGNNGANTSAQFTDAALQRGFDQQNVVGKLDRLGDGLCSLGYDQLNQTNNLNNTVQQAAWQLQNTMNVNENAAMQRAFVAQQQASDCCCENRVGQMNIINQMDKNNCATLNAMNQNTQNLMWSNQQGFRDISDQINAGFQRIEMNQKDAQIAALTQQVNNCNLEKAIMAGNNYVINAVNPRTQPAYITCNPNTGNVFPQSGLDQLGYWQYMNNRSGCCNQNSCCNNNGCCGSF